VTNADMMATIGKLSLAQEDGSLPTIFAAGSAPGESGVSAFSMRFEGSAHICTTPRQHLIWFRMSAKVPTYKRLAGRELRRGRGPAGRLSVWPAGINVVAEASGSVDAILIAIDPGRLAFAAAEDSAIGARLIERFSGHDQPLLDLARSLVLETADGHPNGPLFWNDLASGFIDGLLARHTSGFESRAGGMLGKDVLERLRDYIMTHLDEPIEIATLARIMDRSPFHFSRVFTKSVGVTPHRYIVHLRLQRAIELVRDGRSDLAEVAARTGFADQSHLSRWVRRVYGVSLTQLVA
jgi:AraC family transcriptional regulator